MFSPDERPISRIAARERPRVEAWIQAVHALRVWRRRLRVEISDLRAYNFHE
jgi:hypothetical protein